MGLAIFAVICAYIIKGMSGIGNTLVFSTIMSFKTNNINISPIDLILGYPSNLYITWKERKYITTNIWLPATIMVLIGSVPGILLLKTGNVVLVKTFFGFVVSLVGLEMLLRERAKGRKSTGRVLMTIIGIISGLLCGMFGIGAFLAAYTSRVTESKEQFRGNTCMIFLIENTNRLVLYLVFGILNLEMLKKAIFLLPFMLIGLMIGLFISNRSGERLVKYTVIILLILSGISLVLSNFKYMMNYMKF
jgi:Predicted permeases